MRRAPLVLAFTAIATIPAIVIAVSFGSENIPVGTVYQVLLDFVFKQVNDITSPEFKIIIRLRLPRILAAFFIGGGLSIIGVAMQALIRNPLADPYILGISSGASAGASLFFLGFIPPFVAVWLSVPLAAFSGALLSITIVYLVARTSEGLSVSRLLLAGVAMAALMGSITSFITYLSPDPNQLRDILFWLLGSLARNTWGTLPLVATTSLLGFITLLLLSPHLDVLLLGEEPAAGLGVRVELIKKTLIVLSALVTGILVANSGAIGFIGLIIPHVARSIIGINHRFVVPLSYAGGGIFLIVADLIARTLLTGEDLPVGIVTAIAGVPFFLLLLRRTQYKFS